MNTLTSALSLLDVKYTKTYADRYFNEHPNKYNMLGLSEMLSHYKVNNKGIRVSNKDDLLQLEAPFIAHIGSDFVTVNQITEKGASYIWNGKKINIPLDEFKKSWSGIVLLAESDKESIEPDYKESHKKELFNNTLKSFLAIATIIICVIPFLDNGIYQNIGLTLLTLLNIGGVYVGYLLVLKQLNIQSNHADKICSLFSKSDCNDVLESPAAKLMGVIGWSELGLGYFISNLVIIIFTPHLIPFLALLNICVLPYSIWSVWYQKFKAKQWCPLCLVVQILFWAIFIVNYSCDFITIPESTIHNILLTGVIYALPFLLISVLLPKLGGSKKAERITQEFNSFKMDREVFSALLAKQTHYHVDKNTSSILFGNPEASTLITIFTNSHCEPCARMHKRVKELLNKGKDKFCIQYIFSAFSDELAISNQYLIAVFKQKDEQKMLSIYDQWFKEGKLEKEVFFNKYPTNIDDTIVIDELKKHDEWKNTTRLSATPTILVNGYELPNNYKIENLIYFIDLDIDSK